MSVLFATVRQCIDFKAFKTVYQFLADTGGAFING